MNSNEINGAKNALLNSLMYYRQALLREGCIDIDKEIATQVGKAMVLSTEQTEFIANSNNKVKEILSNSEFLLKHMCFKNELDKDSIQLILNGIDTLKSIINE